MEKLAEFVAEHLYDDTSRLMLDRDKWPGTDMELAVNCIESRRKLRDKVRDWYNEQSLVFPAKLSAEQCSSSATASYKASLASHIASETKPDGTPWEMADLTGGLGVDSWFFSKVCSKVLYCEMKAELCMAAKHNFKILGADNITVRNCTVVPSASADGEGASVGTILNGFSPDIIYLDPARRREDGKKVFLIEDCLPDILTLKDELFLHTRHILLKLSPMADISMAMSRLGNTCREIHAVANGGECKELLIWMDRTWSGECTITASELHEEENGRFTFTSAEERNAVPSIAAESDFSCGGHGLILFEPGKALMKTGAFNIISEHYGINKLSKSTHYYIAEAKDKLLAELKKTGKIYRIVKCSPLDKRTIKEYGQIYTCTDVTARNIYMDSDSLRKRLQAAAGKTAAPKEEAHIFGLKSDSAGNLLIAAERI